MRRFFIWLGVALMVFAFVILIGLIILPSVIPSFDSVPPLKSTFQLLFCNAGETLQDSRATYNPSPGTTVTTVAIACVDNEGNGHDISSDVISAGAVGYLGPFLIGLFMTLIAASREKIPSTVPDRPQTQNDRIKPVTSQVQHQESAVTRLKELKSALEAGLITQAEYDAKHQEILSDM